MITNTLLLCLAGVCPFAGLMLSSPKHGHIGTFCSDGSFTLPFKQQFKIHDDYLLIAVFKIDSFAQLNIGLQIVHELKGHHVVINTPPMIANALLEYPETNFLYYFYSHATLWTKYNVTSRHFEYGHIT